MSKEKGKRKKLHKICMTISVVIQITLLYLMLAKKLNIDTRILCLILVAIVAITGRIDVKLRIDPENQKS